MKLPASRHPLLTSRNSRSEGGSRRPSRASAAATSASLAGANPSQVSRTTSCASGASLSGSCPAIHSALHRSRNGRHAPPPPPPPPPKPPATPSPPPSPPPPLVLLSRPPNPPHGLFCSRAVPPPPSSGCPAAGQPVDRRLWTAHHGVARVNLLHML